MKSKKISRDVLWCLSRQTLAAIVAELSFREYFVDDTTEWDANTRAQAIAHKVSAGWSQGDIIELICATQHASGVSDHAGLQRSNSLKTQIVGQVMSPGNSRYVM